MSYIINRVTDHTLCVLSVNLMILMCPLRYTRYVVTMLEIMIRTTCAEGAPSPLSRCAMVAPRLCVINRVSAEVASCAPSVVMRLLCPVYTRSAFVIASLPPTVSVPPGVMVRAVTAYNQCTNDEFKSPFSIRFLSLVSFKK